MALLHIGEQANSAGEALRRGWLTGLLGTAAALYWLAIPIHNVGGLPWALAIPCAILMGAYLGLYGGVFTACAFLLQRRMPHTPVLRMLALACLWYGLELVRGTLLTGFPWLMLSAAFAPYPLLIQGASLVGSYALSAWYVGMALSLYQALLKSQPSTQRIRHACLCLCLCASMIFWGMYTMHMAPVKQGQAFPVIMVEGNIDQNVKWEPALQQATLETYSTLSLNALDAWRAQHPNIQPLLIWPETSMPFFVEHHPILGPALLSFVKKAHTPLLVGAPASNIDAKGLNRPYNRAYFISEYGELYGAYDKVHLVPFGEYVPAWMQWNFLEGLLQSIGAFSVGTQDKPLRNVELSPPSSLALGMLICYEGIFPYLAQQRVLDGATVLLNISNDGWFGDSSAAEQHLQLSLMRAVEQGRWLIRNTNTGISAIIDNYGQVRLRGAQFKAQSLSGEAQTLTHTTFFHAIYAYIPWILLGIFSLCVGYGLHAGRVKKKIPTE